MTTSTEQKLEAWADIADEEEDNSREIGDDLIVLPPPKITVDEHGVRTTIAYVAEKSIVGGKEVITYYRTLRKSRQVTIKRKRSKAALARAGKLSKFGALQGKPQGPEKGITDQTFDEIYFVFEHEKGQQNEVKEVEQKTVRSSIIKCKNCGGAHWTNRCPEKQNSTLANNTDGGPGGLRTSGLDSNRRPGAYIPPNMRGGGGGGGRGGPHDDSDPTIRISNIPENATQDDMNQLLRPFHMNKLRLAKKSYHETGNRGFAFVTFDTIQDAYTAMVKLTGHRYGHMVLNAEWSDNYKKKYPKGVPITDEMRRIAQAPLKKRYDSRRSYGRSSYDSQGGYGRRGDIRRGSGSYKDRDLGGNKGRSGYSR